MIKDIRLRLDPATAHDPEKVKKTACSSAGFKESDVTRCDVIRRNIDARQRRIWIDMEVRLYSGEDNDIPARYKSPDFQPLKADAPHAVVVGAGPAGLFASLKLIEHGIKPILLERGKDVDSRRKDMAAISREGIVNPDSNYCFGEGGAGAFSDGKLFTRSKKRGNTDSVLAILHRHGAQDRILIDAHPHIGTDRLPEVIKAIRHTIERCGGEIHFNTRVTDLLFNDRHDEVIGVVTAGGEQYLGPVILATGHSARDVFYFLQRAGVSMEPKGIAVGVRLEHPQQLIDQIRYHNPQGRGPYLPPAEYTMLTRVDGRAVYSFCMCPGGVVIPASSAPGELVVNGMSASSRGGRWANSGMVVEVLPEDVEGDDPLRMLEFQKGIERRFYEDIPDGSQKAPAQRMTDFIDGRQSKSLPASSYPPGVYSSRIDRLLPPQIAYRLQDGFKEFGRKHKGFVTPDAILIGDETRTSSPVRIPRDKELLNHIEVKGLYPCGEGAGYAGGIVSAAVDGQRCAEALASQLKN
ncbi:MAG: FAD-binding protein [Paramuribaculum sp.]|nr:FAD-binding protein [Paramuribaculum sp.]